MKRLLPVLLAIAVLSTFSPGQKRILVSPSGDAIPIGKSQGVAEVIKEFNARRVNSQLAVCSDKVTFGYSAYNYPNPGTNHIGFHQDIMAMWYVAPASGTIDTVYWWASDVGSQDSIVTVRLLESNIYPGNGPGYNGLPKPGKQCWGYFINTNDLDNGIAAFPEDATDPTWYSTVSGSSPSFPPTGNDIGVAGGLPVKERANDINSASMEFLGSLPEVAVGDPFFITVRIYGDHVPQAEENQTGFLAANEPDSMATHNWKFYEHIVEIQPGFICPGWVARGDFNILFWYSMTVTSNIPPSFGEITSLHNTFSTAAQTVQATVIDCDMGNPDAAGVENAVIRYTLNGDTQPDIPMTNIGPDVWEADIPDADVNDEIAYKIVAIDSAGFSDSSATQTYRIVSLDNPWYTIDTGATCTEQDISSTGAAIDTSSFFVPQYPGSGIAPADDGTAGPFDLGAPFTVFGDTFRYAWIGVNGALALGKDPLDTLDVNANGFATTFWDLPFAQKGGRTDTAGASNMPGMFIAPFWADHIAGDSAMTYGTIRYGNNGDPCLFVAEWDSIGAFDDLGSTSDVTTFRAVLNRCDRTVEFQYLSVGSTGLDSLALVGMQADSNAVSGPTPGWVYINRNTHPYETKPRDGWCVRFTPRIGLVANDGWNIVAVSMSPVDANYARTALFPTAVSLAYEYGAGYTPAATLSKGKGYWLKFSGSGAVGNASGSPDSLVSAPVQDKWNLIGGPSGYVSVGDIDPVGTTVASSFYGYGESGYYPASVIEPGYGYWVKVAGAGSLDLSVSGAAAPKAVAPPEELTRSGRIIVTDASGRSATLYLADAAPREPALFELPPPPPAGSFDVRFGSGLLLDRPSPGSATAGSGCPILIQGALYPVTLAWDNSALPDGGSGLVLSTTGSKGSPAPLTGTGSIILRDAAGAKGLRVSASGEGTGIPTEFGLGRNFPNPFNPVTSMTVDIPTATEVNVAVYDLLGRLVSTLMSGPQAAGSVTVTWDGRDGAGLQVPTGMYIVKMSADGFTASQKVMMMK